MKTNSATVRAAFGRRLRLEPLESRALLATASPLVLDAFFAGGYMTPSGWLTEMAEQGDGKVVAAGYAEEAPQGLLLKRFSADGAADLSFGEAGVVRLLNAGWASAVVIQNDGRIIVAAGSTLHRFDTVGQLDLTFGQGGRAELGILQPPFRDI